MPRSSRPPTRWESRSGLWTRRVWRRTLSHRLRANTSRRARASSCPGRTCRGQSSSWLSKREAWPRSTPTTGKTASRSSRRISRASIAERIEAREILRELLEAVFPVIGVDRGHASRLLSHELDWPLHVLPGQELARARLDVFALSRCERVRRQTRRVQSPDRHSHRVGGLDDRGITAAQIVLELLQRRSGRVFALDGVIELGADRLRQTFRNVDENFSAFQPREAVQGVLKRVHR